METWKHGDGDMETWRHWDIKWQTEAQAIFINLYAVCSMSKRKFVDGSFVDEETNESNPFADRLNGLNGLAHLCIGILQYMTDIAIQN
jgi:hypothetical protein